MEFVFYGKLIFVFIFLLIKCCYDVLRNLKWRITGVYSRIKSNYTKQPLNHEICHLETILFRYKVDKILQPPGLENFITSHQGFVDPNYVLSPNVTLYSINERAAIFVESDEDVDVHSMENGAAFLSYSQFTHAKRVITVPMWAFIGIADEIGKPKRPLTFITMTTRCGSSLLLQILDATKKCVIISEPRSFELDFLLPKAFGDQKDKILESIINVYCKTVHAETEMFVFKLASVANSSLVRVNEKFPQSKFLFTYRRGVDVIRSKCHTFRMTPWLFFIKWLLYLSKDAFKAFSTSMGIEEKLQHVYLSYYQLVVCMWSGAVRQYIEMRQSGMAIKAVRYEDMIGNTGGIMTQLFRYLSISPCDHQMVENQMELDSQRNTPLSQDRIRINTPMIGTEFSQRDLDGMREVWKAFDVPDFEEHVILEGTIGKDYN